MVVLALGSKAFVDYGTSGLENPLTHLLIVALAAVAIRGRPDSVRVAGVAGVASLAAVNRLDSLLLFTPVLIAVVAQRGVRRSIPAALLGFAPLFAWESFSVVYYGFPLPNTAYAKLATGIPASELVPQGLRYLVESLVTDPITLISVAGGYAAAFASGERRLQALGVGILAHLAYVVWIGGDFMGGRFLTPAFCAALVPIARLGLAFPSRRTGAWLAAAAAFALLSPHPPLFSGRDYAMEHDRDDWYAGINDERRWYFQWSGWLREDPLGVPMNEHARRGFGLRDRAPTTARFGVVGFLGYNAGPQVHIVDLMALCDPLLARLPAAPGWRIGHFKRLIPRGYMKTLMTGTNQIGDPALARYYAALERVVRGPLFSGARWRAVWQLNSGSLDGLIDTDAYRDPASGRAVRP